MEAEERRARRRAASERWKSDLQNYTYWIMQKRALSARPSYKAHRRARYQEKMAALRAAEDYVPVVRGRPRLYNAEEARQRRRETAREWAAAHRLNKKLSGKENYLHNHECPASEATSEESH